VINKSSYPGCAEISTDILREMPEQHSAETDETGFGGFVTIHLGCLQNILGDIEHHAIWSKGSLTMTVPLANLILAGYTCMPITYNYLNLSQYHVLQGICGNPIAVFCN
jgi:hypothetical protein